MSTFATLQSAMLAQLQATTALAGVAWVTEDAADLDTEISKELGGVGMMGLIGVPTFDNTAKLSNSIPALVKLSILFSEVPSIWRTADDTLHCQDIARAAAVALHGLTAPGFRPLRVVSGEPTSVDKADPKFQYYKLYLEATLTLTAD